MAKNHVKTLVLGAILFAAIMAAYHLARSFSANNDNTESNLSEEAFSGRETELIALLSLKYNLDDGIIRNVIREYSADTGDKKSAVLNLCNKYHLNREVAADILLEYNHWLHSADSMYETPPSPDDDWDKWIRWDR